MNRVSGIKTYRPEQYPVGHVNTTGFGSMKSARSIKELLIDEGNLMVLVDQNGEVYAVDPASERADKVCAKRPEWIVGVYDWKHTDTITKDLMARARELRKVAS